MAKDDMLRAVRALLDEVMRVRFEGAAYAKLARAHGYADGYMRCLLDAGLVDKRELLDLVGDARRGFVEPGDATDATGSSARRVHAA